MGIGKVGKGGTEGILVDDALGDVERGKIAKLAKRSTITRLSLTRVKLAAADELAATLALLPRLTELVLYGGRIADWMPLANVKALRKLFINGVKIDKDLPPPIGALAKLTDLSLLHLPHLAHIDLAGCTKLARFAIFGCKKLRDLSSLHALPALREVTLVGTAHVPKQLEALVARPQIRHVSAEFGSTRLNREFDALLAKHGKTQH